jgi:hypothetical protein
MPRKPTAATKIARMTAAAIGIWWLAGHGALAADGDLAEASPTERVPVQVFALAHQNLPEVRLAPSFGGPVGSSLPDPPTRSRSVFSPGLQLAADRARATEREVVLRNSEPSVPAKVRMTLGKEWLFVYADMGAADSPLRWQGLVGIRVGPRAQLLGGWRRVTYYLSPGKDFDSLDSEGPFLAAQRVW